MKKVTTTAVRFAIYWLVVPPKGHPVRLAWDLRERRGATWPI